MNLLKRLELNGFKSFAQKTTLEFPDGITAIVGPNGSGKSNVIDAIRWLLGEREAKNLRGTKVEDLIFAGTPKRSRLGQAHASLHFDNHSKFFPIEFSEVSVSRQVNRDGVSQYFLNKSEVRLKDIVDFFAHARLGTKGLVVVSQGNSDMFIQASTGDRREMVEEMLGLREFQIKRIDAERRLNNSDVNLEKARALIEEILPHLRSLKRQTNRWEKRGTLAQELKELEDRFFGFQFGALRKKLASIGDGAEAHSREIVMLREAKTQAEKRLAEIEASQPKEREEIKKIKEKTQHLLVRRSELQKEIGRLEAQIEMGAREELPPAQNEHLLPLIERVKHGLEAHLEEEDIEELRRAIEVLLDEIDEALAALPKAKEFKRSGTLEVQFGGIQKSLLALEEEIGELRESEKELEKNQEHFYQAFRAAAQDLQSAKDKIEAWEDANRERSFEKERVEIRIEELNRQAVQMEREPKEFMSYASGETLGEHDLAQLERQILKHRGDLASMGEIDEALIKEARETEERYQFLDQQSKDLQSAKTDLEKLIRDLTEKIRTEFDAALIKINKEFNTFFQLMFNGGHAKLKLAKRKAAPSVVAAADQEGEGIVQEEAQPEKEDDVEEGIDIELSLPRKRIHSLEMLSGGERSLVGIAALFALISVSPPPFLVLDEVDAALDERNARRFAEILKEFSKKVQFVIVTHNRATMEAADVLYGVTMNEDGTSKILSLKFEPAA